MRAIGIRSLTALVTLIVLSTVMQSGRPAHAHASCSPEAGISFSTGQWVKSTGRYSCTNTHSGQSWNLKVCLQKRAAGGVFEDVTCQSKNVAPGSDITFVSITIRRDCPFSLGDYRTWARGYIGDGSVHSGTATSPGQFVAC